MGVVLYPVMMLTWRNAGEVWNAVSSVRLLLTDQKCSVHGCHGMGKMNENRETLLSFSNEYDI